MANFMNQFKSSKTRNVIIIIVLVIIGVLLFGLYWSMRGEEAAGVTPTKMPKVPQRIKFEPEAKDVPKEYLKTLLKSEKISVEEAKKKGESSVPVIIRTGDRLEASGKALDEDLGECYQQCVECCRGKEGTSSLLNKWVKEGDLSAEVAAEISKLQDKAVSADEYAEALDRLVREGKITPEQAKKLLDMYREETKKPEEEKKVEVVEKVVTSGDLLNQMVGTGKMDPAVAEELRDLQKDGKSVSDYASELNRLVKEGKITPEQAKQLLEAYKQEKAPMELKSYDQVVEQLKAEGKIKPEAIARLNNLRSARVTAAEYAEELNNMVKEGLISPETAQKMLAAYRKTYGDTKTTATSEQLAQIERASQERALRQQEKALREQQQKMREQEQRKQEVKAQQVQQNLQQVMGKQAQAMFTAWKAVPQTFVGGGIKGDSEGDSKSETRTSENNPGNGQSQEIPGKPTIKAGTIMFAVLDTAVNSDQPGPVMATIVSGEFKGSRLLGSLTRTPDRQRVMLKFNMLNVPELPNTVSINAVAINPDTARTAIASSVDNHYLLRYGSLFASNFIAGYAQAIQSSGAVEEDVGTGDKTITHPDLSAKDKFMVGLGQVGTKLNEAWAELFNREPTVRVESGVGLGVLFLGDIQIKK